MSEVYIVSACRTAIGAHQGQFSKVPATELGRIVIENILTETKINPADVSEVICGNVLTAGQGQNPARQSSIGAKLPLDVTATTINQLCGSGLKAVRMGYNAIRVGDAECVITGGQESMTMAQHSVYLRDGYKMGNASMVDTMLHDGLTDAFKCVHMGLTAESLAKKFNISRTMQDEFAYKSQMKAATAIKEGLFKAEIVPVRQPKTNALLTIDEFVKPAVTLESLSKMRAAFDKEGTVTAGNASGVNDGAAGVMLTTKSFAEKNNLKPIARIIGFSEVGCEPMDMGISPIKAVQKLMTTVNWNINDVDLFEINEAFAVQSIIVLNELKLDPSKVNVTGGAIALGHPIGASGARVLVTLLHNMVRLQKNKGVASLCVGGGMGIAVAVERIA